MPLALTPSGSPRISARQSAQYASHRGSGIEALAANVTPQPTVGWGPNTTQTIPSREGSQSLLSRSSRPGSVVRFNDLAPLEVVVEADPSSAVQMRQKPRIQAGELKVAFAPPPSVNNGAKSSDGEGCSCFSFLGFRGKGKPTHK